MKTITWISLLCLLFFFWGCKKDVIEPAQNNASDVSTKKGGSANPQMDLNAVRVLYIIPADRTFNRQY